MNIDEIDAHPTRRKGFTIIEVIVVVGIIVLLISILIPAVSAARGAGRKAGTTAQMRNIATACDAYFQSFEAYPGVLSEATYDGGSSPNTRFSSSQALVLGLSRAFYTSVPAAGTGVPTVSQVGNLSLYTSDDPSVSPKDYSVGTGRSYAPFINPAPAELSTSIGVFAVTTPNKSDIPVLVDSSFGVDALPILYYREAQRYDSSVIGTTITQPMAPVGTNATTTFAAFYAASNDYVVTDTNNETTGSKAFNNSGLSNLISTNANCAANLTPLLFNPGPGTTGHPTYTAKGSYVLISAGADRYYGADPKGNIDDIIVAGGS